MDDVLLRLTEHHVLLSNLARRARRTTDREARHRIFAELAKALNGHFVALEFAVFPALSRSGKSGLGAAVLLKHMGLKRRLADLLTADGDDKLRFDAELLCLCNEVELQAAREQLELLPSLRTTLDDDERELLSSEVEAQLTPRLVGRLHLVPAAAAAA